MLRKTKIRGIELSLGRELKILKSTRITKNSMTNYQHYYGDQNSILIHCTLLD